MTKKSVLSLLLFLSTLLIAISCNKSEKFGIKYAKTELGGCNVKNDLFRSYSEIENDTVIITVSEDYFNVFVGLKFICKSNAFETQIETVDDVLFMHIIDKCDNPDDNLSDCYMRCYCYYTFDFVFNYEGELNQNYKILLHQNHKFYGEEEIIVISEGIINSKKR